MVIHLFFQGIAHYLKNKMVVVSKVTSDRNCPGTESKLENNVTAKYMIAQNAFT